MNQPDRPTQPIISYDPARTALVVFDMLEAYRPAIEEAGSHLTTAKLIAACRSVGTPIFYARADHRIDGADFARSIADAERQVEWDWLGICNDDVTVDPDALRAVVAEHAGDPTRPTLLMLDPGTPRPIPDGPATVADLALLRGPLDRLRLRGRRAHRRRAEVYRPFSLVLVSRALLERLGGMDTGYVFTGEDADFVRRAHRSGAEVLFPDLDCVRHDANRTGSSHIAEVLPAAAWSRVHYLEVEGVPRRVARALVAGALLVRVGPAMFTRARYSRHLLGIARALVAVCTDRRPSLPAYESW